MKLWVVGVAVLGALIAVGSAGAAALVDSADVVNGSLTGKDVRNSSLTGKDVKNKSLTKRDFRGSVTGPRGFTGPQGPQGPPGPTVLGQMVIVQSPQVFYGAEVVEDAVAFCPAGYRVVSGGGVNVADEQLAATEATGDRSGWFVIGVDLTADGGEYIQAQALCAPTGQAVAASRVDARAQVAAKVRQVERAQGAAARR
jgi:hypothetical protein